MWKDLSEEERLQYTTAATEDKERYVRDLEAWKAAGGSDDKGNDDGEGGKGGNKVTLPLNRIKRLVTADEEIKRISKEGLTLIAQATVRSADSHTMAY
jgi:hypothetical protein